MKRALRSSAPVSTCVDKKRNNYASVKGIEYLTIELYAIQVK